MVLNTALYGNTRLEVIKALWTRVKVDKCVVL